MPAKTSTLSPDHTPVVRAESARDKALGDIFTTALEGGIGYWSACSVYRWSVDGTLDGAARDFIAVVQDAEDEDGTEYVIDRAVIAKGLDRAYTRRAKGHSDYHAQALKALHFGRYDEADYDADTADLIVQFGLFDEVVYG
jgi:hypothetical protein